MANQSSPTVEELQLRKRARRRLIGAITLVVLLVAVLPMVLDDEPKPVGQDISISIPSQQGSDFPLSQEAETGKTKGKPAEKVQEAVALKEDKPESPPVKPSTEPRPEPKAEKPAEKPVPPHEPPVQKKPEPPVKKVESKPEPAPVAAKPKEPPQDKPGEGAERVFKQLAQEPQQTGSHVIMLGAFLSESNAKQRQAQLKELGVKYYLEKIKSPAGDKTGVRAGPYSSRQEAERVLAKLKAAGIQDGLVAEKK